MVSNLIDQYLFMWKNELINSLFDPVDTIQVMSIPLFMQRSEDKFIWHGEKDGEYSVR